MATIADPENRIAMLIASFWCVKLNEHSRASRRRWMAASSSLQNGIGTGCRQVKEKKQNKQRVQPRQTQQPEQGSAVSESDPIILSMRHLSRSGVANAKTRPNPYRTFTLDPTRAASASTSASVSGLGLNPILDHLVSAVRQLLNSFGSRNSTN